VWPGSCSRKGSTLGEAESRDIWAFLGRRNDQGPGGSSQARVATPGAIFNNCPDFLARGQLSRAEARRPSPMPVSAATRSPAVRPATDETEPPQEGLAIVNERQFERITGYLDSTRMTSSWVAVCIDPAAGR
jgi:hypothetical protein